MIKINLLPEKWKVIPDCPDYAASNQGRVVRITEARNTYPGKIIKPSKTHDGYHKVLLVLNTKNCTYRVGRLVASLFLKPYLLGYQIHHINGIKTDDRANNLQCVTVKQHQLKNRCPLCKQIIRHNS